MAEQPACEHFIPLHKDELVELLCCNEGLTADDRDRFRRFCRLMAPLCHLDFNRRLEELKSAYAPFDPDCETRSLVRLDADEKQRRLNDLFSDFAWLLERANFKHLSQSEVEPALHRASDWGIRTEVDFGAYERLAIFVRGDTTQLRSRRRVQHLYRKEEVLVPIYQRLVLMLKLRSHRRLGAKVDTENVYLKIFKDIPKLDVVMLLPGARVRFTLADRSKVGLPLLSGLGLAGWKIVGFGLSFLDDILGFAGNPTWALWGLTTGALGYGYRSYYGYQQTKQRYHLSLTESLYFRNLDSNAGVLFRLLDEAEEQECREAILAYFFLWRQAGDRGWTSGELDRAVEGYLEQYVKLKVDFETSEAIATLQRLGVLERRDKHYRVHGIDKALANLGQTWMNFLKKQ
jgi:hypothetical protein